jgi:ATP-dependent DNA helicase HFM1/MER3
MRAVSVESGSNLRIVAVSATIPNLTDIASWLSNAEDIPAEMRTFGDSYRPVKLQMEVLAFPNFGKNPFMFENNLDYKLPEIISKYADGKPTLIFCRYLSI